VENEQELFKYGCFLYWCVLFVVLTLNSSIHTLLFCSVPGSFSVSPIHLIPHCSLFPSPQLSHSPVVQIDCGKPDHPATTHIFPSNSFPLLPSLYSHSPTLPHFTLYFLLVCASCLLVSWSLWVYTAMA
jgi:hypothetical protein